MLQGQESEWQTEWQTCANEVYGGLKEIQTINHSLIPEYSHCRLLDDPETKIDTLSVRYFINSNENFRILNL